MASKTSRTGGRNGGSPPSKKPSKKPAASRQGVGQPKRSVPAKSVPKKGPVKPVKQTAEEKRLADERKTRRFARADRKKKRDNHLKRGSLTADQKQAIGEISDAVRILDQYLEDDPQLFGKLREEMAPSFTILRRLAYKNPSVSQEIAKDLYSANYVPQGDTDDESQDEEDEQPRAPAGPGGRRGRKIVVSDEDDESGDEEPVKEPPKRSNRGQSRKNKSKDVLDRDNGENPKGTSGGKPRKPTGGHDPPSAKRKESSSEVDGNDGPPSKRLRRGTPLSDDDKVKDVQPKKSKNKSCTVKAPTNVKSKSQPKATAGNTDTVSSITRSGSQPPEDEADDSTQKRSTRRKK